MDFLIGLLIFAGIAIFQFIFEGGLKKLKGEHPDGEQSRDAEAERIRKFMEALGQRPDSTESPQPIERVQPKQAQLAKKPEASRPPVSVTRSTPPPVPQSSAPPLKPSPYALKRDVPSVESRLSSSELLALKRLEENKEKHSPVYGKRKRTAASIGSVHSLLCSPDSLKKAIIAKEILDSPKGLQSF